MNAEQKREGIKKCRFWYHKIDLGDGVFTPGQDLEPVWDNIRESRQYVDYKDKRVLDIASFDGMWAFEAEQMGASQIVATDCYYDTFRNFLFCKEALGSEVIPYYNISPYDIYNRLDVFFQENWDDQKPYERLFDIVQHLGLFYHLRDPLYTLSQSRSVIKVGGTLLIETAAVVNSDKSFMLFNGVPPQKQRIYDDLTTWWAPTIPCLKELLKSSLFEPIEESIKVIKKEKTSNKLTNIIKGAFGDEQFEISRICMVAKAVGSVDVDKEYFRELTRTYRNPGLVFERVK